MNGPQSQANSAAADAPPLAVAAPLNLALDGDEIIQIVLRPAPWYILFVSYKILIGMLALAVVLAVAYQDVWNPTAQLFVQFFIVAALARLVLAGVDWAGRLYVLTNRRVLRFRGILQVEVAECRLDRATQVALHRNWYQRLSGTGTIRVIPCGKARWVSWTHVARPRELHVIVETAVRRAQG